MSKCGRKDKGKTTPMKSIVPLGVIVPPTIYHVPSLDLTLKDMESPSKIFKKMIRWTIPTPYEQAYYSKLLTTLGWNKIPGGYVFQNDDGKNPLPIFTSHLDVVGSIPLDIADKIVVSGNLITCPNGFLGADDRTGVSIILWLAHTIKLQGMYLLFEGEEIGCKGVQEFLGSNVSTKFLLESNICISLDRKGYTDIVTSQMGQQCCSNSFAAELQNELFNAGMHYSPAQGMYTDSYYFINIVPEVVNLSVGYFGSHSHGEIQDVYFMDKLAVALTQVDWLYLSNVAEDEEHAAKEVITNTKKPIAPAETEMEYLDQCGSDPYYDMMDGTAGTYAPEEQELLDACDETGMSRDELAWVRRDWDYSKQGSGSNFKLMKWEKGVIK